MASSGGRAAPQLAGAALALSAAAASAQAPTTPPPVTPMPATPGLQLPPAETLLPRLGTEPADGRVARRILFSGHTAFSQAELDALAAPFVDRPLRGWDVEELRQRVTRAYVDRGYVNSGAVLDADAWRGDTLTLRIVEGVVERVRLHGMPALGEAYVAARLTRDGEPLDLNRLQERFQLLLADPLFDRLNARVLPGSAAGRALLDIDATPGARWSATLFAHNHGAPAVGSAPVGIEASLRNLLGWGDVLQGSLQGSRGSEHGELSWTLPLAGRRTLLTLRAAQGDSSVIEEPLTVLDIASRIRTHEVTLAHPVLDGSRTRLVLGVTAQSRANRSTLAGEPFSFVSGENTGTTRVHAWRLFQELVLRGDGPGRDRPDAPGDGLVVALRSTIVDGRNNLSGIDPLPGQASRRYRLWIGQAQAAWPLGADGRQLLLRGTLQRSADRLVPLEQIAIGGRHTVRGYRENTLVRDEGQAFSAELHWPLWRDDTARARVTLVPFVDTGAARQRGEAWTSLSAAGVGLQWQWADWEGDLYLAHRLEPRPQATSGDWQDHGIHVSLRYRLH